MFLAVKWIPIVSGWWPLLQENCFCLVLNMLMFENTNLFLMKSQIVSMNEFSLVKHQLKVNNPLDSTLLTNATGHLVDKAASWSGCRAVTVRIHSHAPHSLEFCFKHLDAICFVPIFQVAIISVTVHSGMGVRACVVIPAAVRLDTLILVVSGEVQLQQKKKCPPSRNPSGTLDINGHKMWAT